ALLRPFYGDGIMFLINAVGCLSYLTGLYLMRLAPPERAERGHANGIRGILAEIGEGVAYVRGHVGIGPMFFLLTVGAIWVRPLQDLLPGFADEVFHAGSSGLGWLTAGMGVGAMFSAMAVAMYGRTGGLTLIMMMAFLVNMIATLGFVATSSLWFAILMGAVWGATLTLMTTAAQAVVQSAVDNSLRARVMSIYSMIYRGAPFVGALVIGAAADVIGLQPAFAIATLICVPAWLLIMVRRRSMTLALEGQASDLDRQLTSAARGFAAMQYERLADLRACVRRVSVKAAVEPAAKRLRSMGRRTQATLGEARIGERVSGALQRCRLGLAELRSRVRESRRPGKDVGEHSKR
ncbi:MAG: MFS transporter, partial [Hyphomicrobiaceae bacterium]